ncbi:MAG: hypothetical protein CL910_00005 [Deltaproteobacteria bacterium]|jgi:hypothetical protein|nr:hypothetical protein [Deltaproteobacteria bacterium]
MAVLLALACVTPARAAEDRCGAAEAEELVSMARPDGFGGTGLGGDRDGIGGTGRSDPDGLGGTGRGDPDGFGGTGLFGTITAFGSICVNGHRVLLPADLPIQMQGELTSADVLRVGHVVWVVASAEGEQLQAREVQVWLAARGPIEEVDLGRRRLRVAGRWVTLLDGTPLVDQSTGMLLDPAGLTVGESVAVSGLIDGEGRIFATRVERLEDAWPGRAGLPDLVELARRAEVETLSVEGFVSRPTSGELRVGSLPLTLPPGQPAARELVSDSRVWVRGHRAGPTLQAERIALPPIRVRPGLQLPAPLPRGLPLVPRIRPRVEPFRGKDRREISPPRQAPAPAPVPSPKPRPAPVSPGVLHKDLDLDRIEGAPVKGNLSGR